MSRCTCLSIERGLLTQASIMPSLKYYNICGRVATSTSSGVPTGESPVESEQANVEDKLRHHHTQLFDQHDVMTRHKMSPLKRCVTKEYGNQNRIYRCRRLASTFACPNFAGLSLVEIPEAAGICDSSTNIAGPQMTHYECLCQCVTLCAPT
ncbi:hypothetical protein TNCV_3581041 [Trichonephila clavipes]|nr:hypothetical protein TNCV_3581041 [Trichonephila clavipes]